MNKTTKALSLTVAMFAMVGMMGALNTQVFADPAPDGYVKVYNFMMIAKPNVFTGSCGEGDRLFVSAGAKGFKHAHINIVEAGEWNVSDCNATGHNRGEISFNGIGDFSVFAIARGPPDTGVDICADPKADHDAEGDDGTVDFKDHLCLIGEVSIKRTTGKSSLSVDLRDLFENDAVWSVDVDGNPKIQFVVYQKI